MNFNLPLILILLTGVHMDTHICFFYVSHSNFLSVTLLLLVPHDCFLYFCFNLFGFFIQIFQNQMMVKKKKEKKKAYQ